MQIAEWPYGLDQQTAKVQRPMYHSPGFRRWIRFHQFCRQISQSAALRRLNTNSVQAARDESTAFTQKKLGMHDALEKTSADVPARTDESITVSSAAVCYIGEGSRRL